MNSNTRDKCDSVPSSDFQFEDRQEDVDTIQNRILKCDDCGSLTLPGKYIELKNGQIICTECHPA